MELSEQLGVIPHGLSDTTFAALQTALFKDLEPGIELLSPTLSTVSQSDFSDLAASVSPTLATFASLQVQHTQMDKWVPQCSICLEDYAPDDVCVMLECTHFFHQPCVWVSERALVHTKCALKILDSNGLFQPPHAPYANILSQETSTGASFCDHLLLSTTSSYKVTFLVYSHVISLHESNSIYDGTVATGNTQFANM